MGIVRVVVGEKRGPMIDIDVAATAAAAAATMIARAVVAEMAAAAVVWWVVSGRGGGERCVAWRLGAVREWTSEDDTGGWGQKSSRTPSACFDGTTDD